MEDSIWNFISLVYQAKWDFLYADNNSTTLRAKISSKFTLRVALNPSKNNKETTKHVLVTIKKPHYHLSSQLNRRRKSMSF